jgi:hypothetical protein
LRSPPTNAGEDFIMADCKSLGIIGFVMGGVTALVMLVAATVVVSHLDGRLVIDSDRALVSASLPALVR